MGRSVLGAFHGLLAAGLMTVSLSSMVQAKDGVISAVEVQIPELEVELFDSSDAKREIVRTIAGTEFPAKVKYLDTRLDAGRMHHIELVEDGKDYWVDGNEVWVLAFDGEIELFCDAEQSTALAQSGRGVGGRSSCKSKDKGSAR